MDGMIQFNGVIGFLVLFATIIVFSLIVLVNLISRFVGRKNVERVSKRPKNWLFSALLFLVFDLMFLGVLLTSPHKVWEKEEAIAFDERMFYFWVPCHIAGYFLLALILRFVYLRKEKINAFVDKLR